MTDIPSFAIDYSGTYINNTLFMISGENLHSLLPILNSPLTKYQIHAYGSSLFNSVRYQQIFVDQIQVLIEKDATVVKEPVSMTMLRMLNKEIKKLFANLDIDKEKIKEHLLDIRPDDPLRTYLTLDDKTLDYLNKISEDELAGYDYKKLHSF